MLGCAIAVLSDLWHAPTHPRTHARTVMYMYIMYMCTGTLVAHCVYREQGCGLPCTLAGNEKTGVTEGLRADVETLFGVLACKPHSQCTKQEAVFTTRPPNRVPVFPFLVVTTELEILRLLETTSKYV